MNLDIGLVYISGMFWEMLVIDAMCKQTALLVMDLGPGGRFWILPLSGFRAGPPNLRNELGL